MIEPKLINGYCHGGPLDGQKRIYDFSLFKHKDKNQNKIAHLYKRINIEIIYENKLKFFYEWEYLPIYQH